MSEPIDRLFKIEITIDRLTRLNDLISAAQSVTSVWESSPGTRIAINDQYPGLAHVLGTLADRFNDL